MKTVKVIALAVIVFLVVGFMRAELRHLMHEGFWPGLAGVLICVGGIVVAVILRGRARQNARTRSAAQVGGATRRTRRPKVRGGKIRGLLAAYPGPITLKPSGTKWWIVTVLGVVMTTACIFVGVLAFQGLRAGQHDAGIGLAVAVFGVLFFGWGVALSVRRLSAGALQLDGRGFQVTLFGRKEYLWNEVSDLHPYRQGAATGVRFDAVRPRYVGRMNTWFGYSNDALTDTYGLAAEELVDLMESWQSAALDGQEDELPLAPAVSEQSDRASDQAPAG